LTWMESLYSINDAVCLHNGKLQKHIKTSLREAAIYKFVKIAAILLLEA